MNNSPGSVLLKNCFTLTRKQCEPNEIVRKFPLTNENFSLACDNLCSRYENKRVLFNIQLKFLFKLDSVKVESAATEQKCWLCPKHSQLIRKCPQFLKMNHSQGLKEIKKSNLCINSFSKTHTVKNCPSKLSCYKCGKRHNTMLHKEFGNDSSQNPSTSSHANSTNNNNSSLTVQRGLLSVHCH